MAVVLSTDMIRHHRSNPELPHYSRFDRVVEGGSMVEVVHIEIVGIQEFIFRSRTLIDTIGRSHQVQEVTSEVFMISGAAARGWPENALSVEFAGAGRVSVVVREDPDFTAERLVAWYTRALANISDALSPSWSSTTATTTRPSPNPS
ncbi:hypothetical protein [Nocardia salmonicida]|uniref:hypothetical protein n=1 Tax=Nocardia salmonicida TaxID=53431 RepID=UPI003CF62A4E